MKNLFSISLIPPVLTFLSAFFLAVLSIIKGKLRKENVLFSIVCIWNGLLPIAFICHHFIADETTMLTIERGIHFFYVYLPFIILPFFHLLLGIRRRYLQNFAFVASFIISWFTLTDYYFYGFYNFSWGRIAKGGPVFQLFGIYCIAIMIYLFFYLPSI